MCATRSTEDRETTYRLIIAALRGNPAYLLLFSIGLLGGAMGVGTTAVGFFRDNTVLTVLGFATWALLLAGSFLVIRVVENRDRQSESMLPGIDEAAWRAFLSGPSAERLAGALDHRLVRWGGRWKASL